MPSNFTEHFNLSQWEPGDQVLRKDFNRDNAIIDAALAGKGDCHIAWGTPPETGGNSKDNPLTLTFPFQPKIVLFGKRSAFFANQYAMAIRGQTSFCHFSCSTSVESCQCAWTENGLSWYSEGSSQFRFSGSSCFYVALG